MKNRFRRWGLPAAVSVQRKSAEALPSLEARGLFLTIALLPPETSTTVDEIADELEDCPRRVAALAMRTLLTYRFVVKVRYQLSKQANTKLNGTWVTDVLHKDTPFSISDLLDVAYDYGPGVLVDSWRGTDRVNADRELVPHKPPAPLEARSTKRGEPPRILFDPTAPAPYTPDHLGSSVGNDQVPANADKPRFRRSDRRAENDDSVPPAETPRSPRWDRPTEKRDSVPPAETVGSASSDRLTVDRVPGERSAISSSPSVRPLGGRTDGEDHSSDRGGAAPAEPQTGSEPSEGPKEVVVQSAEPAPEPSTNPRTDYSPEAWRLVLALPWPAGQRPNQEDAVKLARRLDAIVAEGKLDFGDLEEHLAGRLRKAGPNPPVYAMGALEPNRLPIPRLRPVQAEPVSDSAAEPEVVVEMPAEPRPERTPSEPKTTPWCGDCGVHSRLKRVKRADGRRGFDLVPCEACHPDGVGLVINVQSPPAALPAVTTPADAGSALSEPLEAHSGAS